MLLEALSESRAVALLGARQVGKSTLARDLVSADFPARFLSLDQQGTRNAAAEDPVGFVAEIDGRVVVDEVQRVPELLLAIKQRLDTNQNRGQFLLTGSANLLTIPTVADALPGRVEYVNLWPFSQSELERSNASFIERLFADEPPRIVDAPVGRSAFAVRVAVGGYPEAQGRGARSRARFFSSYLASILGRDLTEIAKVRDAANLDRLLRTIAARSGSLASFDGMGGELGLDKNTVAAHTKILEDLFLIRRLQPWHVNLGSRQVKSAKIYIVDSGLLGTLLGADEDRIKIGGAVAGSMLESFVAMELLREAEWSHQPLSLFHYRDRRQREVDVVIERSDGSIAGVESKVAATVSAGDFTGLRYLRDKLGARFKGGAVLYTGPETLPFGDRLHAVPVSALWS